MGKSRNFLIFCVFLLYPLTIIGQSVLTNKEIIDMVSAGLGESIVISKIKNSPTNFTTDVASLKALTDAKVPETVITAMIERQAQAGSLANQVQSQDESKAGSAALVERKPSPEFIPYTSLDKTGKKQRLKGPAQIAISAPAEKVSGLLTTAFMGWNYSVRSSSSMSIHLIRPVKSFGASLLAGMVGNDKVQHEINVSIAEAEGLSFVTVNLGITMENAYGKTSYQSLNGKDKDRIQVEELLMAVKRAAER